MKTILATAFALMLSSGAYAQTQEGGDQSSGATSIPSGWVGPIAEAFYTDGTGMALKPEAEAKANFAALTPEQQAMVKSDCMAMSEPVDSGATTGSTDAGTSAAAKGNADEAQGATAKQICMWVAP